MVSQRIINESLEIEWSEAPWDSALFGFPVFQITHISITGSDYGVALGEFERLRETAGCRFVSCRLDAEKINESMALEALGFRYIETTIQPIFELRGPAENRVDADLSVELGSNESLAQILQIAGSAFCYERFHVDPRMDKGIGDIRYQNWVRSALMHPCQELIQLRDGDTLVAFFVVEKIERDLMYWHLNAVNPTLQGRGYGLRAWCSMIREARSRGVARIRSNITVRNVRVMNLYAKLGFRFLPPQMTFHWLA